MPSGARRHGLRPRRDDGLARAQQVRGLLLAYGIPLVPERVAASAEKATAADELGYPVVIKTAAPGAHKTETGGIALDLTTDEAVRRRSADRAARRRAADDLGRNRAPRRSRPGPGLRPARRVRTGRRPRRADRGSVVPDCSLDRRGCRGARVGREGRPPRAWVPWRAAADVSALVDLVQRLSRLGLDVPAIAELDLNPVLGFPDRCIAVDARVRISAPRSARRQDVVRVAATYFAATTARHERSNRGASPDVQEYAHSVEHP